MSTTKASILALASTLCYGLGDTTEMDRLYYEVELELAHDPRMWHCGQVAGSTTFSKTLIGSTTALAIHAWFYRGRELVEVTQEELDALNPSWRDDVGEPIAFIRDFQNNHEFRLYPKRGDNNAASDVVFSLRTITTDTNIVSVLELPFALFILAREFARESVHRDLVFAQAANKLANDILDMVA